MTNNKEGCMGKMVIVIVIIAMFTSFFYVFIFSESGAPKHVYPKPGSIKPVPADNTEIIIKIKEIAYNTDAKNAMLVEKAIKDLNKIVDEGFNQAEANIPYVLYKLAGFKGCATLTYYHAKDKLNGTNEAEKFILSVLKQYIIEPSIKSAEESQRILEKIYYELARNHTDMLVEMATASKLIIQERNNQNNNPEKFIKTLNELPGKTIDIAVTTISSTVGIALEGIFIKSTMNMVRNVLGAIAAKVSTTTLASITSAAADGPLPVGDAIGVVIAVGGAVWTAHDLYKAQYVMKDELSAILEKTIKEYRQKTMADFENEIQRVASEYKKLNKLTVDNLIATL